MAKLPAILIVVSLWAASAAWVDGAPPNLDKALSAQYELVTERPQDATAHNDLGNLLSLSGRVDEAEAAYRKAVGLDPLDPSIRFNLALLLQQSGSLNDANQEYYSLLELDPENAWAHYQLGVVAFTQGKRKQAKELYARSFALDPTLSFPRHNPHVIDNPLATEALLMSSRFLSNPTARVPRQYAEAARIAELMLEEEKSAEEEAAAQEEASEEESAYSEKPPNPTAELMDEELEADGESRVLTNEDLEDLSPVGQAGGRNVRRGGSRGSSRYSSGGRGGGRNAGAREQDPRSRYRPRSSESRNRSLEKEKEGGGSGRSYTTLGSLEPSAAGRGSTGRPEVGQPRPGSRPIAGRPITDRPTTDQPGSVGRPNEPYRPGTGSTAQLRLELLDDGHLDDGPAGTSEAVGP